MALITKGGDGSAVPADGSSRTTGNWGTVPTAGSVIAVGVGWSPDTGTLVSSVTDTAGNTYVAAVARVIHAGSNTYAQIWYAKNVATATPFNVTVTLNGSAFGIAVSAVEFKDTDTTAPLDKIAGQAQTDPGTATDAVSSGSLGTPTTDGQVVFAVSRSSAWPDTFNPGTGFTSLHSLTAVGQPQTRSEYLIQTTAAAVAGTFTQDSTTFDYSTAAVTFKPLVDDLDLEPEGVESTVELGTPTLGIVQPGYLVISRSSS